MSASPFTTVQPFDRAPQTWTHSPELRQYTDLLVQSNLNLIGHRLDGLRRLYAFTLPDSGLPADQVRTCSTIMLLPFLRISKKLRTNSLNAEFVSAGRNYNRSLVQVKALISSRLSDIAMDDAFDPAIRRLASATKARSSAHQKVEHAELIESELPEHLLPPMLNTEPDWLSQQWEPPTANQNDSAAPPVQPAPPVPPAVAPAFTTTITNTQPETSVLITPPTKTPHTNALSTQPQAPLPPNTSQAAISPPHPLGGKSFGMPNAKRGPFKKRKRAA